ncbi:MAG TPA: hypothetical protein VG188_00450 [Solirubrobacteraceae bacterium]|jgi:hypothetical protein|nr:hypothetical protein [Solirubrobacteraceae bacterium]
MLDAQLTNVIPIHDMGLHEDSLYIVMRYVAGGDLKTLLTSAGPLDAQQARRRTSRSRGTARSLDCTPSFTTSAENGPWSTTGSRRMGLM